MANPINPTKAAFQHSGKNADGTPFTVDQFKAVEVSYDSAAPVALTLAFATDGKYSFTLPTLALGTHSVAVRMSHVDGQKSALTPAVPFDVVDTRVPDVPFGLSVS